MSTATRILTGSLATLAVASCVGLAAPAAYADAPARPCGQPAVPAVFATVVSEPVLRQVPAVTHDEWRWERHLTTLLREYSKVVTPADTTHTWTRTSPDVTEFEWSLKVVTQAARDAVAGTAEVGEWQDVDSAPTGTRVEYEYVQHQTGNTRWEAAGWNGVKDDVDHGVGWAVTDHARQWVVTQGATQGSDAVPEISHLEYQWSATSPGAEWTRTSAAPHVTPGATETKTTHGAADPGNGWTLLHTDTVPAVVDTKWASEAPEGYTETGADPQEQESTDSTAGTSATAPQGDGWSKVTDSKVTVIDHEASTELVGGGTQQVLVRPALSATDACPTAAPSTQHVAGPKASGPTTSDAAATGKAAASAHATTTVLPATGNPVSPLLVTTGIGALLAGGALVRVGRRRQTS
jgi:hypothetical protein